MPRGHQPTGNGQDFPAGFSTEPSINDAETVMCECMKNPPQQQGGAATPHAPPHITRR